MIIREIHFFKGKHIPENLQAIFDIHDDTPVSTVQVNIKMQEREGHTWEYRAPTIGPRPPCTGCACAPPYLPGSNNLCTGCVASGACTEERETDCHSGIPMKG